MPTPFVGAILRSGGPRKTLKEGLISFWPCATNNAVNLNDYGPNAQTLTNNGVVTAGPGPGGNLPFAAVFVAASSQYLSRADSAALSMGAGVKFSFFGWVKFDALPGIDNSYIFAKTGAASWEYIIYTSPTGGQHLRGDTNGVTEVASAAGGITTGVWYPVYFIWDGVNHRIGINAVEVAAVGADATDTALGFAIGADGAGTASRFTDGSMAGWGIWKRVLTAKELAYLRAAPRGYPF